MVKEGIEVVGEAGEREKCVLFVSTRPSRKCVDTCGMGNCSSNDVLLWLEMYSRLMCMCTVMIVETRSTSAMKLAKG